MALGRFSLGACRLAAAPGLLPLAAFGLLPPVAPGLIPPVAHE